MDEDEALSYLANGIFTFYRNQARSSDDFEAYAYGLRMKIGISEDIFAARFKRGYEIIMENMANSKKKP
jgi:hypothetical protein